jgi:hypothetical protein
MYPSKRRRNRQASRALAAKRQDAARRRAVPHLFRPLKREKNRGIYDRAASRQEGKKKKKAAQAASTKLLWEEPTSKNLGRRSRRERRRRSILRTNNSHKSFAHSATWPTKPSCHLARAARARMQPSPFVLIRTYVGR